MAQKDQFANIGKYYNGLVDRYGHDPRACDYGQPSTQHRKFDVLTQVVPLQGKSVLEVGCGFADLYRYIEDNRHETVDYTGIDLSNRMVEEARKLNPKARIEIANILEWDVQERYDVVFAVGVFYLLGDQAQQISRDIIARMFSLANEAVSFSTLSSWAPDPEEGEYYWDPVALVDFCSTLTPYLVLKHDYHPRDMTLFLYKGPADRQQP